MACLTLFAFSSAFAQYDLPNLGYGFDIGITRGDNAGSDENIAFMMRGDIQVKIGGPVLTQIGLAYSHMTADGPSTYSIQPFIVDARLLVAPIRMEQMFPFLYAGLGVSKDITVSGSSFLPFIPIGIGIQSKIGPQLMFKSNVGYNIVLSDEFDNHTRTSNNLNRFTNGKQDGYYEFMLGLVYTGPAFGKKTTKTGAQYN